MTDAAALSSAMEDYLEAILNIAERSGIVRVTDIASRLGITKASVAQAIANLKELGLVKQERYGPIELTQRGREIASKVQQRHLMLKRFLIEVLGVDPKIAERDACLIEHAVSPQTMEKLMSFLESLQKTPGATEEGKEQGTAMPIKAKPLSDLGIGEKGRVTRITAKGSIGRRILEMGVTPGSELSIVGIAPLGDPIEVMIKGYRLSLRKEEASYIMVEVL